MEEMFPNKPKLGLPPVPCKQRLTQACDESGIFYKPPIKEK